MSEIAILPSRERFRALARAGNVISVSAELIADSETPVSAFQKVDDGYCFLLNQRKKTKSQAGSFFVGIDPRLTIQSSGRSISISEEERSQAFETSADLCAKFEAMVEAKSWA